MGPVAESLVLVTASSFVRLDISRLSGTSGQWGYGVRVVPPNQLIGFDNLGQTRTFLFIG